LAPRLKVARPSWTGSSFWIPCFVISMEKIRVKAPMKFKLCVNLCALRHVCTKASNCPAKQFLYIFYLFQLSLSVAAALSAFCKPQLNGTQYFVTQSTPWNNDSTIFYKIFLWNVAIHH
jgi:hypothetical protein